MREIKFRARYNKEVWEVIKIDFNKKTCDIIKQFNETDDAFFFDVPFDEVVLLQYTGHKDKNNKEIYEGDTISCYSLRKGCPHDVIWCNGVNGFYGWYIDKVNSSYVFTGKEEIIDKACDITEVSHES